MAPVHFSKQSAHNKCPYSCLRPSVVYILLCAEVYTTAPERSRGLNDHWTKQAQHRSVKLCRPVLVSMHFIILNVHHCWAASSFHSHFLDHFPKPNVDFVRERKNFGNWLILRRWSIAKLDPSLKNKKVRPMPVAPWPQVSWPPFLTAKKVDIKNEYRDSAPLNSELRPESWSVPQEKVLSGRPKIGARPENINVLAPGSCVQWTIYMKIYHNCVRRCAWGSVGERR